MHERSAAAACSARCLSRFPSLSLHGVDSYAQDCRSSRLYMYIYVCVCVTIHCKARIRTYVVHSSARRRGTIGASSEEEVE